MDRRSFAIFGILMAMLPVIGFLAYARNYQISQRQTNFCLYIEQGDSGIARLRYTQELVISLFSDTELEIVYTAKTSEDLHNEKAQLILSSGLAHINGTLLWEGDLDPEESLTLAAIAHVSEDGSLRVRGTIGFSYSDTTQIEHADLYVIVENGRIVDITLASGETAPKPQQIVEKLKQTA